MKSLIQAVVVAAALAAPVAVFAQSNQSVTRAQVRAELVQLEQTGWRPAAGADPHYPDDIQAAEAKVAAMNGAATAYGGAVSGSAQSGNRGVAAADWSAMYSHP
jgi:type II secretory pathway pseudopilin PulG